MEIQFLSMNFFMTFLLTFIPLVIICCGLVWIIKTFDFKNYPLTEDDTRPAFYRNVNAVMIVAVFVVALLAGFAQAPTKVRISEEVQTKVREYVPPKEELEGVKQKVIETFKEREKRILEKFEDGNFGKEEQSEDEE